MSENYEITIKNVRGSFLHIFHKNPLSLKNNSEGKYDGVFLLPKSDVKTKAKLDALIKALSIEKNKGIIPKNICIKDGDEIAEEKNWEGYADHWVINANNAKRPSVFNHDLSTVTEEDDLVYSGAHYNIKINLYYYNNTDFNKKGISANLLGIQFVKHDEPFSGGARVAKPNDFEKIDVSENNESVI